MFLYIVQVLLEESVLKADVDIVDCMRTWAESLEPDFRHRTKSRRNTSGSIGHMRPQPVTVRGLR